MSSPSSVDASLSASPAALLRSARSVVVFTGAGVSAESGVPTYRSGDSALWSTELFERYATTRGYQAHLPKSYEWYRQRALAVAAASPNAGHRAIARLAALVPEVTLVTQNVDTLHRRAGSLDVVELHGSLREARCDGCDRRLPWTDAPSEPWCGGCGGTLRPDVVLFGEMLPQPALERARVAALRCDVLVSVGTSNLVWPAKELPMIAHAAGADVLIVNTDFAGQPSGERIRHLRGPAGEVLPPIIAALEASGAGSND